MIEDVLKQTGESENHYIYRVCAMKADKGWTWPQVADILNNNLGHEYDESCYRKKYQSMMSMLDDNQDTFANSDSQLAALQAEKDAIKKERIKLQTSNLERNRIMREDARSEMWFETCGQYIKSLDAPEPLTMFSYKNATFTESVDYMQCFSDLHFGADFKSVNNEYSPEIARERVTELLRKTIRFTCNNNVNHLTVLNLGDQLQGLLRVSDVKFNATSMVKSAVEVSRLIASYLNKLSEYVAIDYYQVPTSNHTQLRVIDQRRDAMPEEDLEFLIESYIYDLLKNNERVVVHMNRDHAQFVNFKLNRYNIVAMHGHRCRNVDTILDEMENITNTRVDYVFMGHLHSQKSVCVGEADGYDKQVLVVPSIVGSDPYSDSLYKGSKSAAMMYGFTGNGLTSTTKFVLN